MRATRSEMRAATAAERKARAIPPAYTNAMIAVDPEADLQATAVTPAGKTAYFYSATYVQRQVNEKWARVRKVTKKIDAIAERVERDSKDGIGEAMTIRLILQTGLRNGGKMQGKVEAFGASSLRMEHVVLKGDTLLLTFPGKKGVAQAHSVTDPILAAWVRAQRAAGCMTLFNHDASDTLRYLRSIAGIRIKVHDLRTWYANVLAAELVARLIAEASTVKKLKKLVGTQVAERLGNTASIALKSYIHPSVFGE